MTTALKSILYIAPEIPGVSTTFVYKEILELQHLGHNIHMVSVFEPASFAENTGINSSDVLYLKKVPPASILKAVTTCAFSHPGQIFSSTKWLLADLKELPRNKSTHLKQYLASIFLADYIKKNDIQHIHAQFAGIPATIAMYASRLSGIDYSVTGHAYDLFLDNELLTRKINRSKFFATISNFNVKYLSNLGIHEEKLQLARCGVDIDSLVSLKIKSVKQFRLGFLGRLVEKKGIHILLRSLAELQTQHPHIDLHCTIGGSGPEHQSLATLAKQLSLKNVTFLGEISNQNVPQLFESFDVFVLPAIKDQQGNMDGIPVVLMEAMALGIPVISTDISGINELIIDGETGLLCQSGSPEDLAKTIHDYYQMDDEKKSKLKRAARTHIEQEFNSRSNAIKLSQLIISGD